MGIMKKPTQPSTFEIKFTRNYANTYEGKTGNAFVNLQHIFIGNSVVFDAEIIDMDNLDLINLKGYVE